MAKYSTGGIGGDSGGACELCGAEDRSLQETTVAGATLHVCDGCAKHGDGSKSGVSGGGSGSSSRHDDQRKRRKKAARNVARLSDARKAETAWEEGTDYEDDPLPYLVSGYGDVVEQARQDAGLTLAELAEELGVDEDDLTAVEQGRAARGNVGGSVVEALESYFDVELIDE